MIFNVYLLNASSLQKRLELLEKKFNRNGLFASALKDVSQNTVWYSRTVVNVDTGSLRSSITSTTGNNQATIFHDPNILYSRNPKHTRPYIYSYWVNKKYGSYWEKTYTFAKQQLNNLMKVIFSME